MGEGEATMAGTRRLDHLVLPVSSLSIARTRLTTLGFTVAEDASHPFGTENACVFFADQTYLEPLAVGERETCEAEARRGNVFIARDQAYRFRRGPDGFSAAVFLTGDAARDHAGFVDAGLSAGAMLEFGRSMRRADGTMAEARFRLAFAGDLRSPDFFGFTCQRLQPLPADRGSLQQHENGVTGIRGIVLSESNPTDFQYVLQELVGTRAVEAHSFGMDLQAANARISVLNGDGLAAFFGLARADGERGLRACAILFTVADLAATERLLAKRQIAYEIRGGRLLVAPAPGQGALLAFGD